MIEMKLTIRTLQIYMKIISTSKTLFLIQTVVQKDANVWPILLIAAKQVSNTAT